MRQRLGAQLVQDARQHVSDLFGLGTAGDGESVGGDGCLHLRVVEVDHRSVLFDHVHLLNARNVGDGELLQIALELFVVGGRRLVDNLLLSAGGTLAASPDEFNVGLELFDLFGHRFVHDF